MMNTEMNVKSVDIFAIIVVRQVIDMLEIEKVLYFAMTVMRK